MDQMQDQSMEMSDADMDAILNQSGSSEEIFPMDDAPAQPETQQAAPEAQAQAPAQPEAPQTHQIQWNGKTIEATFDQLKQWAQMGYDYPQKMADFKKQQEEFNNNYGMYQKIDQFAKQNPQWWSQVEQLYQQQFGQPQAPQSDDPVSREVMALKNELEELKQFKSSLETEKMTQERSKQDEILNGDIQSMREQYKHLDWQKLDERGYDLEMQILAYANEHNIGNFKDAFRSYNFDRLMSLAEERGKEAVVKESQKKTKLGLLGQGSTPKREISQVTDIKNKSYNDIYRETLEELGIRGA